MLKYPNQFLPYLSKKLDENSNEIDLKSEFKGTLFRFPIRIEKSELSNQVKSVEQIIYEDILNSFFEDFNLILLFLKRIERIEIYEILNGVQKLIASTFIDYSESSDDLKNIRMKFNQKLNEAVDEKEKTMKESAYELDDLCESFKMVIKTNIFDSGSQLMKEKIDKYLVTNYVRLKSSSNRLKDLAFKIATFPICGVAYKIENNEQNLSEKFKSVRYFCFLPMPETIERSGLPLHINGSFGLRDDRRDFRWLSNDTKEDDSAKWNEVMFDEVLNEVLHQFINFAKSLIEKKDPDFKLNEFYYLIPNLNVLIPSWRDKHLKVYLNKLTKLDLIYTQNQTWMNISNVYLMNKIESEIDIYASKNEINKNKLKQVVYYLFKNKDLADCNIPDHVINTCQVLNKNLKYIDSELVCESLKETNDLNDEQNTLLINFLIQNIEDLNRLSNLKLVPLLNLEWTCFTSTRIFFLKNKEEMDMFSTKSNSIIFNDSKLNLNSRKKLLNHLEEQSIGSISLYNHNNVDDFIYLLTKSFETNNINTSWLNNIWKHLRKSYDHLTKFENFKLIPKLNKSDELELFTLKPSTNVIYFYYQIQSNEEISPEFVKFIDLNLNENILIFNDLPSDFVEHSKRKAYMLDLSLHSFSVIFKTIFQCLGEQNMIKIFKEKMSNDCKTKLSENFNSMNQDLFSKDQQLLKIGRDVLPIFKSFKDSTTFETAKYFNYEIYPSILKNKSELNVSPNINMIDCLQLTNLSEHLALKEYPLDKLIIQSIDYYLDQKNEKVLNEWFKFSLMNSLQLSSLNNMKFLNELFSKPIFKIDESNEWFKINQFYDSSNKYVDIFVPIKYFLPENLKIFYSTIKNHLKKEVDLKYFIDYLSKVQTNESIKTVFEFIDNQPISKQNELLKSSLSYQWLTSNQNDRKLYKSCELWSAKFQDFIKFIEPIVDNSLVPEKFHSSLLIRNDLNDDIVFKNYMHIVSNKIIETNIIKQIYSHFKDSKNDKLFKKFDEKYSDNFIFTFDSSCSFKSAKQLVLDYPNECNLSPYLFSLNKNKNKIISDLESLYVKVFKVKTQVTLLNLIEILELIKTESEHDFIKVRNIIDLIETNYLEELLSNEHLKMRLLLPVMLDSDKIESFDLEIYNKCVYLVEDENNIYDQDKIEACKQKELKICHLRLKSYTFLKAIGVKSFTQSVMNIESLFIKKSGQKENLTDRIRKLLDGYKDGIAIFKEAIQNADDANANILKICYDKRANNEFKNSSKLLDKCMVSAQGQALIFYNDSVFTENDFNALTELGSGSKRESKDKIGKFGLGFNAFYNITVS
jgi:hypothetical protein